MTGMMDDILDLAKRSEKPRKAGLTMIVDRAWIGANSDVAISLRRLYRSGEVDGAMPLGRL